MNIPTFDKEDDRREYFIIFNRKLDIYVRLFETTVKRLFGADYTVDKLTASSLEIVDSITRSLLYDVELEFCKSNPKYKDDAEPIFLSNRTVKEIVTQVIEELNIDSGSNPA